MKQVTMLRLLLVLMVIFLTATVASAKSHLPAVTDTVMVWGNCGMCKSRIEKAAVSAGATKADWDVEKHVLSVVYPSGKTSLFAIEKKIAAAGHDTQNLTANDAVYKTLPGCCKYERKPASNVVPDTKQNR